MEAEVIEVVTVLVMEDVAATLGIPSRYANSVRRLDIRW
jgi:hypothetical protein